MCDRTTVNCINKNNELACRACQYTSIINKAKRENNPQLVKDFLEQNKIKS